MKKCIESENWKLAKLKSMETQKRRRQERVDAYSQEPVTCKYCGTVLSYQHRNDTFCNSSCSTSYSNLNKPRTGRHNLSDAGINNIRASNKRRKGLPAKKRRYSNVVSHCIVCGKEVVFHPGRRRKTCSEQCYRKILSETAHKTGLGGNHNRRAFWYESPIAGRVWLESSFEEEVAKILDENQIQWIRPKPVQWTDSTGSIHKYYPDFFLCDYNIYLDPKNQYLRDIVDREKIASVIEQNKIKLVILTKNDLNIERLQEIIEVLSKFNL